MKICKYSRVRYIQFCEFREKVRLLFSRENSPGNFIAVREEDTLGARDFSSAVSGFCQVFIVTCAKRFSRGFGLRPKLCRPSADKSRRTREKPLVPRVGRRKRGSNQTLTAFVSQTTVSGVPQRVTYRKNTLNSSDFKTEKERSKSLMHQIYGNVKKCKEKTGQGKDVYSRTD